MTWVTNEQPFGVNHAPTLVGSASDGSGETVPVAVDKDTGELLVSGGGGSGGNVNLTQIDGNTASVGNGTTDTGTLRVTISSDSTGQVKLTAGANTIGAISNTSFAATQSGAWTIGANSATGSAVPSNAFYMGLHGPSGNLQGAQSASIATGQFDSGLLGAGILVNGTSDFKYYSVAGNNAADGMATGISAFTWSQTGIYNGTSWDRLRGDTTNGVWVNVKTAVTPVSATIINGQQSVTATAAALASHTVTQSLTIEALSTNTISVFVGATGVTTATGIELSPGSAVTLPVSNSNVVFVIASTTGATVTYVGV